jgi:hypothetical protein
MCGQSKERLVRLACKIVGGVFRQRASPAIHRWALDLHPSTAMCPMQDVLSCSGYEEVFAIPVPKPAKPPEKEIVLTGIWGFLSRKLGIDPWGQILIVALIFLSLTAMAGFRFLNSKINELQVSKNIEEKLAPLNTKVDGLTERMSTIEGELKVLLSQNSLATAGSYAKEGKIQLAVKAVQRATDTVATAATGKLPASPEYFVDTIAMINGIAQVSSSSELSRELQDARLSLAEYRSALVGEITFTSKVTFDRLDHAFIFKRVGSSQGQGNNLVGGYFDASKITGDIVALGLGSTGKLSDNNRVQGTTFIGASQTLDGIHWITVTFIRTKIRYAGGELDLEHVTFVGCTFEAPDNKRGARFAEYVALLLPSILIS